MIPRFMRVVWLALCLSLLGAACTSEEPPPLPSTSAAADALLAAWEQGNAAAMVETFAAGAAAEWPEARLQEWWDHQLSSGLITEVTLERADVPERPERRDEEDASYAPVPVAYAVTYRSDAASAPVTLAGTFDLVLEGDLESEDERWAVVWDHDLAWPGLTGARRFDVVWEWPRRAAILDRRGRVLARGAAEERTYPFDALGGSTIGHLASITRATLDDAPEGRSVGDFIGGSGLEAAFDERLAGTPTTTLVVRDLGGDVVEELGTVKGEKGEKLRVTLDVDVQRAAERGYGSTIGGAAVVQPDTGDILALVDSGAFDPNNYVGAEGLSPFNRALVGRYPPGSAMKVVTAAAALDSGKVDASTRLRGPAEYKGVRNFESGSFGSIDFATALKFSVNTAFAQVAERLGAKRMTKYAEAFGFNRSIDMPLGHGTSQYPKPEDLGDLMWSSIGQAQVLATPLHMATVAATVANGGKRMEPRIDRAAPKRGERVMSKGVAARLTTMMEGVVAGGTGTGARVAGTTIAGKTGTAEVDVAGERRNHAWFIAFAPSGAPKVAIAVVSEYGGVGGQVAAPLARQILQNVLPVAP